MKERRIAIGGLLLPEDSGWEFCEDSGVIVGMHRAAPGTLQIHHVEQNTLTQPLTHESCLSAMGLMRLPDTRLTERKMWESVSGPYGMATYICGAGGGEGGETGDVLRTWYCCRPPGLIYGIYACRSAEARGSAYEQASRQCAHIMADVLFDRASWGAPDDPLTKVLHDTFERLEGGSAE